MDAELQKNRIRDLQKLHKQLNTIFNGFKKIHMTENRTQEEVFIDDLRFAMNGIEAILNVYQQGQELDPGYIVEKLDYSLSVIKHVKQYFENNDK